MISSVECLGIINKPYHCVILFIFFKQTEELHLTNDFVDEFPDIFRQGATRCEMLVLGIYM